MAALAERHAAGADLPRPRRALVDRRGAARSVDAFGCTTRRLAASPCELRLGGGDGSGFVQPVGSRLRGDQFLRLDAVICAIHGTGGEDGALLGALEHTDIPYAGGGVGAGGGGDEQGDREGGLPRPPGIDVDPDFVVSRDEYARDPAAAIADARRDEIGLPCFVKPASLGSSIGVSRCADAERARRRLRARLRARPHGAGRAGARRRDRDQLRRARPRRAASCGPRSASSRSRRRTRCSASRRSTCRAARARARAAAACQGGGDGRAGPDDPGADPRRADRADPGDGPARAPGARLRRGGPLRLPRRRPAGLGPGSSSTRPTPCPARSPSTCSNRRARLRRAGRRADRDRPRRGGGTAGDDANLRLDPARDLRLADRAAAE